MERLVPTHRRFPVHLGQCSMTVFVPIYRCGTVPDSHRVPFSGPRHSSYLEVQPVTMQWLAGTFGGCQLNFFI